MNKLKIRITTILMSIAVFVMILGLSQQTFARYVNTLDEVTSMNDLMDFAAGSSNYWTVSPSSFIGRRYENSAFDWTSRRTGYCIDHDATGRGTYIIKNVIDVEMENTSEVKIYSGTTGKVTTKALDYKSNDAKAALMWARIAYEAYHNNETAHYNFYYMLNKQWDLVSKLGIDSSLRPSSSGIANIEQGSYDKAEAYANQTKNVWIEDKTTKSNVSIEYNSSKKTTYIGPYKIAYGSSTPKISAITLNADGKKVKASGIATKLGGNISNVSNIKSNASFYIAISGKVSKATSIKLQTSAYTFYRTRIILVDAGGGNQSGIIFKGEENPRPLTLTLPNAMTSYRNLEILKVDYDTKEPLKGVGFKVYSQTKKAWVAQQSPKSEKDRWTTDKDKAKIFYTGADGKATIYNLPAGNEEKYDIYEVFIPKTIQKYYSLPAEGKKINKTGVTLKKAATSRKVQVSNVKYFGNIVINKVDAETNEPLEGIGFKIYSQSRKAWVKIDSPYRDTSSWTTDESQAKEFFTDSKGQVTISNVPSGTYTIKETSIPEKLKEIYTLPEGGKVVKRGVKVVRGDMSSSTITIKNTKNDTPEYGDMLIVKTDAESGERLEGIGFKIYNEDRKEWVKIASPENKNNSWTDKEQEAIEFKTNSEGEAPIDSLPEGTYTIKETSIPEKLKEIYTLPEGGKIVKQGVKVTTGEVSQNTVMITNQKNEMYVKLSGYVWVDRIDESKTSKRNDLYKDGDFDQNDVLLDGITVRLKDRTTGQVVKETTTAELRKYTDSGNNGHGEYLFEDVLIEKLGDYYIEFEYDGLTYTNVIYHTNVNNGSKAIEGDAVRGNFNKKFTSIEGGEQRDTGITRGENGNKVYDLQYQLSEEKHTATLDKTKGYYPITATTDAITGQDKYNIKDHFVTGQEEIRYINLGLYERTQPDLNIKKDLQNVKLAINGYEHTYIYNRRFEEEGKYDGFNVGVKFGINGMTDAYGNLSYTRAIYQSDYEYENPNDKSKELKAYITYQIAVQSLEFDARVNSMVDYYDSKYTLVKVGKGINEATGEIVDDIQGISAERYNNEYNKVIIPTNMTVEKNKATSIYVQFELNREAVINILNDKENLENVVEINSYSIFEDGKIYAGIDKNSNPGNCIPGDTRTYEGDTDASPALKLEVADAREMAGKVFLDSTTGELKTGEVRQGTGIYEDGEIGIEGVDITLKENVENGKVYTAKTDANGDFLITGFVPGDYTLTYTWGDETYTVQDYKGTIYNNTRDQSNKDWYKENVSTRYTDAMDNYSTEQEAPKGSRKQIDEENNATTNTTITRKKMDSTTPTMGIGIEYETTYTASTGDKYIYRIENVDFGIVERARQVLDISKDVTAIKITLANGQTVVDAQIVDGKIEGEAVKGLTYMGPFNGSNGLVKAELDNELIQGANLQIEYTIRVNNNSELDYDSENYYQYGIQEGNVVKMKPSGVYDYLDSQMTLDTSRDNGEWEVTSKEEYETKYESPTIIESYFNHAKTIETLEDGTEVVVYKWETSDTRYQNIFTEWVTKMTENKTIRDAKLDNKTILHNAELEKELQPAENNTVKLYTSKLLSNSDEIDLNNDTEITEIRRTSSTGRIPNSSNSNTYDKGETVTVTPPTGENQNYIIAIMIGVSSFIILGVGVVLIKKKILK